MPFKLRYTTHITFDNMKRLGFRGAFLSIEENAGAGTKAPQTTEPQLFYIVCCVLRIIVYQLLLSPNFYQPCTLQIRFPLFPLSSQSLISDLSV